MFQPLDDRILILPTPDDKIRGGLQLSDSDIDPKSEGTIVAMGKGVPLHNVKLNINMDKVDDQTAAYVAALVNIIHAGSPMQVKVGDLVYYGKYAGTKIMVDDVQHVLIRYADVFGII